MTSEPHRHSFYRTFMAIGMMCSLCGRTLTPELVHNWIATIDAQAAEIIALRANLKAEQDEQAKEWAKDVRVSELQAEITKLREALAKAERLIEQRSWLRHIERSPFQEGVWTTVCEFRAALEETR